MRVILPALTGEFENIEIHQSESAAATTFLQPHNNLPLRFEDKDH